MGRGKSRKLKVLMNGAPVGRLVSSPKGVLSFTYDRNWLEYEGGRAISLSLPLTSLEYSGPVVENYFDNLLPDSQRIRSRLQGRVGADSTREVVSRWQLADAIAAGGFVPGYR
jgi:serine/threonine-protein kinase HipA